MVHKKNQMSFVLACLLKIPTDVKSIVFCFYFSAHGTKVKGKILNYVYSNANITFSLTIFPHNRT